MTSKKRLFAFVQKHYFPLLLIFFTLYSLLLIFKTSVVIDHVRYFTIFDDEMISMRYGYNLAHGYGLVWNQHQRPVEGFTTPPWTLYMGFIHMLPIPIEKTSLVVQLTCLLLYLVTLLFVKKTTELLCKNSQFAVILSVLFTAFYFPLLNWNIIQATAVSLLMLCFAIAAYLTLRSLNNHKFSLPLFLLLGIGTVVRLDFVISATILIALLFLFEKKQRKGILTKGLPILFSFLVLQVALRFAYYHAFLPNTYFLKMTGFPPLYRITRGIYMTLREFNWVIIAVPFFALFLTKNKKLTVLLTLFVVNVLYSMYVGADAWEWFGGANRYTAVVMPLFFITLAYAFWIIRTDVAKKFGKKLKMYKILEVLCALFLFLILNTGSDNMLFYLMLLKPFPTVSQNANQINLAKSLNAVTKPHAVIGIVQAGVTPYFSLDRTYIDLLGKTEDHISHGKSYINPDSTLFQKYVAFWPGHTKWDYPYVLSKVSPDIFGQVYPSSEEKYLQKNYKQYTAKEGFVYFVRKNSQKVTVSTMKPLRK